MAIDYNRTTLVNQAYAGSYGRKNNWPLEKMLMRHGTTDIFRLVSNGMKYDGDNGAFAVITGQQYIIGNNAWDGCGTHHYSFARCMSEMSGRHQEDLTVAEMMYQNESIEDRYITFRIEAERIGKRGSETSIRIFLPRERFTQSEVDCFDDFYERFGSAFDDLGFTVDAMIDKDGRQYWKNFDTLSSFGTFMKSRIDDNIKIPSIPDEVIVGYTPKTNRKTR